MDEAKYDAAAAAIATHFCVIDSWWLHANNGVEKQLLCMFADWHRPIKVLL